MPDYFPAFLDLRGRRCLVVGGGEIGERKTHALLDCGARVTIVSPSVTTRLAALAASGRLVHRARPFRRSDPRGCALAVAATGDPRVDRVVAAAARRWRALVNVVDRPQHCDFIVPAVLRRGELQIAVSTGGRSPAIAREIRRRLERFFGPEYGELISRAGEARNRARAKARTSVERIEAGERVARLVLAGRLPV
ncbi:MAG TPA: bifunctional precorrin-2 dehydrogenase/sirohydrochlorin ferrochelatase [Methylomirabilota bacterium]|jgi:precorrin-2 dehydrogenase/sirohydrochlorin ferrochelatase|nr:bifunctional precorrin-2 dehydrogenase/sirohydrochlorin ferrochelatase [Methylomirabilota bacterium]